MLVNWIKAMGSRGFPITSSDLISSVSKIAAEMNISGNFKNAMPGKKWLMLFRQRHNLVRREVEKLTSSRARCTEEGIKCWFQKVEDYFVQKKLTFDDPRRIFNMDESAFLLCPKGEKVLTIKGTRNVYEVCSSNEKESLTVLLCVSAAGTIGPSLIVYPGQRYPKNLEQHLPDNWSAGKSEKGWINGEVFYEYIANVFHPWLLKCQIPLPVILFVDGHSSHLTLHLSNFAAANV